ncbi:MAG: dienelactone hydrolase family protein [Pseudomonadota bacterium]
MPPAACPRIRRASCSSLPARGPFPAVVVLHGCGGIGVHDRAWAKRLTGWGYAALTIDSFGLRGFRQGICTTGQAVPPTLRARDAFAAAAWLRTQPEIDGDHIGVIGFSHGGWTVLKAVSAPIVQAAGAMPFRAAVAYYPVCDREPCRRRDRQFDPDRRDRRLGVGGALRRLCRLASAPGAQRRPQALSRRLSQLRLRRARPLALRPSSRLSRGSRRDSFAMARQFFDARLK